MTGYIHCVASTKPAIALRQFLKTLRFFDPNPCMLHGQARIELPQSLRPPGNPSNPSDNGACPMTERRFYAAGLREIGLRVFFLRHFRSNTTSQWLYFPMTSCCAPNIFTNASQCAGFFSFLYIDFCVLVIEQPMQWPSRLNLQTPIHGLGVFLLISPPGRFSPG